MRRESCRHSSRGPPRRPVSSRRVVSSSSRNLMGDEMELRTDRDYEDAVSLSASPADSTASQVPPSSGTVRTASQN